MSESRSLMVKVILALLLTPLALCAQDAPPSVIGRWTGFGDIVVSWTRTRTLAAELTVADNGGVTGTIGDATVIGGRFRKNRGRIASLFGWKTQFIIEGDLQGSILRDEGLIRQHFRMPLNLDDEGRLSGSVSTDGPPYGGFARESFVSKLRLKHR